MGAAHPHHAGTTNDTGCCNTPLWTRKAHIMHISELFTRLGLTLMDRGRAYVGQRRAEWRR